MEKVNIFNNLYGTGSKVGPEASNKLKKLNKTRLRDLVPCGGFNDNMQEISQKMTGSFF